MKVLIVGGGIGGLTTALCCLHFGHDVSVFEKAPELGDVGAGIQIPPNAMKVFRALGVEDDLVANGFLPEALEARMGRSGRSIFKVPLSDVALKRWGAPYLHIHRGDYIDSLRNVLAKRAPEAVNLGANAKNFVQGAEGVTLHFEDGRQVKGDILVGADGIKSRICEHMLGPDRPVFTGNMAWRAVVPIDALGELAPDPTACVWMGPGRHAVTYRLRRGDLINFVGVVERSDWTQESWTEPGSREDILKDFEGWHPILTNLIKKASPEKLFRWALFDRPPLRRWTDGRVALLGDAAHPMLPFMAQGAAMAVEDAWVLAREISKDEVPLSERLAQYQNQRLSRAHRTQAASRANMKTFHKRTRLSQLFTYGPMWMGGTFLPHVVHQRLDWLYEYDVTQS